MNIKKELKKPMKGFILDVTTLTLAVFILAFVFILFAYVWPTFRTGLDNNISNSTMNATLQAQASGQINGLGNSFFLNNGQDIILLFWFAMVISLFITAKNENASFMSIPIGVFFMVAIILTSFIISDAAHAILTSTALGPTTAMWYSGVLYLMDNLPLVSGVLCTIYLVLVTISKGEQAPSGGGPSSNVVTG